MKHPFPVNQKMQKQPLEVFYKKGVLRNFTKITGKHLCQSLFFNKKALAQVLTYGFCGIFKNIFFSEHSLTTAS